MLIPEGVRKETKMVKKDLFGSQSAAKLRKCKDAAQPNFVSHYFLNKNNIFLVDTISVQTNKKACPFMS